MSLIKDGAKRAKLLKIEQNGKEIKPDEIKAPNLSWILTPEKQMELQSLANNWPFGVVNQLIAFLQSCPKKEIEV